MGFNKETVPESIAGARPWPYENRHNKFGLAKWQQKNGRPLVQKICQRCLGSVSDQWEDVVKNIVGRVTSTAMLWNINPPSWCDKLLQAVVAVHQAPGLLRTCCRKLIIPSSSKKEWPTKSHKTNRTSDGSVTAQLSVHFKPISSWFSMRKQRVLFMMAF